MWWGQLHFAQPPRTTEGTRPRRSQASTLPPLGGEKLVRPFLSELLTNGPIVRGEPAPHGLDVVEDPLFRKSLNFELTATMRKLRGLSKGFHKDYMEPLSKAEPQFLTELQTNHSSVERKRRKKETLERAKSTPSYDQLAAATIAIGSNLDPNFEANRREIQKAHHKRKRLEELLVQEPEAPANVNPHFFYELLDFVNRKFATRRGSGVWTENGYTEFFDAVSFSRSWLHDTLEPAHENDTVCANEWVTMLKSMKFPGSSPEILQLHRDLSVHGLLTRGTFTKLAPLGCFLFDCKLYGVHQARILQLTRKQGFVPTAPQSIQDSVYDLVHGTRDGGPSAFSMMRQRAEDAVATKMNFIENQKQQTEALRKRAAEDERLKLDPRPSN